MGGPRGSDVLAVLVRKSENEYQFYRNGHVFYKPVLKININSKDQGRWRTEPHTPSKNSRVTQPPPTPVSARTLTVERSRGQPAKKFFCYVLRMHMVDKTKTGFRFAQVV